MVAYLAWSFLHVKVPVGWWYTLSLVSGCHVSLVDADERLASVIHDGCRSGDFASGLCQAPMSGAVITDAGTLYHTARVANHNSRDAEHSLLPMPGTNARHRIESPKPTVNKVGRVCCPYPGRDMHKHMHKKTRLLVARICLCSNDFISFPM